MGQETAMKPVVQLSGDVGTTPAAPSSGSGLLVDLASGRRPSGKLRTKMARGGLRPLRVATFFLSALAMASPLAATPAFAAGSAPAALHTARAAWSYYATYPDYASCVAAGKANPQGRNWQCIVSARPGVFDLYLWF